MRRMQYQTATVNRLGNRTSNQDRYAIVETEHAILLVLADGMGGHSGGKLASTVYVDAVVKLFNQLPKPIKDPVKQLKQLTMSAHMEVVIAGEQHEPPLDPRTTSVVCIVQDQYAWWAHAGDSRLYVYRKESVLKRTTDHSRVEELFQQGLITEQEKHKHPQRNIVTRCIGSKSTLPNPTVAEKHSLQAGDILLLCTDGLWGALDEAYMGNQLQLHNNLTHALDALAYDAESQTFPHSDNISAAALRWLSDKPIGQAIEEDDSVDVDDLATSLNKINQAVDKMEKDN